MVDTGAAAVRIEEHRSRIIEVEGIENFRDVGGLQNMARGDAPEVNNVNYIQIL